MDAVREVAITVDLSHYRATVHYTTCGIYTGYHTHHNRTIPPSVKIKMCVWCKPTAEDVIEIANEINWLEKHADVSSLGPGMVLNLSEGLDRYLGRRELYGARDRF